MMKQNLMRGIIFWYKAQIREKLPPAITQYFQKSVAVVDTRGFGRYYWNRLGKPSRIVR